MLYGLLMALIIGGLTTLIRTAVLKKKRDKKSRTKSPRVVSKGNRVGNARS